MFLLRFTVIMIAAFIALFPNISQAAEEKPVLRVGMPRMSASFIGLDADVGYSGYAYEYIQNIALYGGFECRFVEGTLAECRTRLINGEIDVLPGEVITGENMANMDFTDFAMGYSHLDFVYPGDVEDFFAAQRSGQNFRIGTLGQGHPIQGIPASTIKYNSFSEMEKAYKGGLLDGYIADDRYNPKENILAQYGAKALHLAVKKGNADLLKKLNDAEQELIISDPELQARLYKKYCRQNGNKPLTLTAEEIDYLKKKGKIIAVGTPGEWPHSGFVNGKFQGTVGTITERIASDLGIEIEVVETKDNEESFKLLNEGKAEIIVEFYADYNWGREHNLTLTTPYLTLNYMKVVRRGGRLPENPKVAVARGHFYPSAFIMKHYDENQIIYCDTMDECLDMVSSGAADIAFAKSDAARYSIWQGGYYDLVSDGNIEFSHDVSVGIAEHADPILLRILNKEINHLDPKFIESVANRDMIMKEGSNFKLKAIVYSYPMQCVLAVVFLATVAIALFAYNAQMRRRHAQKIQKMAYEDRWTGRYNWRWFEDKAQELKDGELKKECADGRLGVIVVSLSRREILVEAFGSDFVTGRISDITADFEEKEHWIKITAVSGLAGQIIILGVLPEGKTFVDIMQQVLLRIGAEKHGSSRRQLNLKSGIYMLKPADDLKHAINCAEIACSEIYGTASLAKVYDKEMEERLQLQQKIEDTMEEALRNKEFQVWYQPKFDIRTHTTSGAEALVRWQSPTMGFLPPGKFIDIFEANGFVAKLDFYMLENVCRFQRERLDAGLPIVCVSVNQSRVHLMEPGYLQHIQAIKNVYRLPDGAVELELTETAFSIYDQPGKRTMAMAVCRTLQRMGFSISMDDFGSGYSSIMLLNLLKLDVMKIDKSLLTASGDSSRMEKVLSSVIEMGKKLNMEIICEGIEEREQEELLLKHGCHYGQGFIYAKPMPEEEFADFLNTKPIAEEVKPKK